MLDRHTMVARISAMMPLQETVTYYSQNLENGELIGTYTPYTLPGVRPRKGTKTPLPLSQLRLRTINQEFEIYRNNIQAIGLPEPKLNDYLRLKNGDIWTVIEVKSALNGGVINVNCKKLATNLTWIMDLKRPTTAQDTAGRPTYADYTAVVTNASCYLQRMDNQVADMLGRKITPDLYVMILDTEIEYRPHDVVTAWDPNDQEGTTADYTVLGGSDPEQVDNVMRLYLQRIL